MGDETFHGRDGPSPQFALSPSDDPVGRLEPLAVPVGRLTWTLRRHIGLILMVPIAVVCSTAIGVHSMTKRYTAEASILVEPQRTQVSDLQAISADLGDIGTVVRTQIDILRSPTLAVNVVKVLDLTEDPEFYSDRPTSLSALIARLKVLIGTPEAPTRQPAYEDKVDAAAAALREKIGFANEAHSGVLRVSVTTESSELSAKIANEISRQFLDYKRQAKFAAMQRAHDWFQDQMGPLAEQLKETDEAIESYRQQHGLDSLSPSDDDHGMWTTTVNRQQLEVVIRQLVEVSRDRARIEGDLEQAQHAMLGQISPATLPVVLGSPIIGQLLAQTSTVAGREAQLRSSQGPGNPELVAVQAELRKLRIRTNIEMNNVLKSLGTQLEATKWQEAWLHNRLEKLRSDVAVENSAQLGLRVLLTKARATRGIYESFLNRATQLANVAGIQEQDASLISSARPPLGPSAPQAKRILMVAAALSLVLGVAIACVIERMRGGFTLPEQVEATLGLPLVGLVPQVSPRQLQRRIKGRAAVAFAASLDRLRSQIRIVCEGRAKVVMITSALPQEGKSMLAERLSRNAAAAGWRVLLLDCDFGCPSLAQQFGLVPAGGLSDLLSGSVTNESAKLITEPQPGLHLITAGRGKGSSQELLASNRMNEMLTMARSNYDLIVLDTPPVLPLSDSQVLASKADATLLVIRWEKTPRTAAQDAVRLLLGARSGTIGAVMARVDLRTAAMTGGRMSHAFGRYDRLFITRS